MAEAQASALPDPGRASDLAEFIELLDRLRVWGGDPSFRDLAKRVGLLSRPPQQVSKSTIADLFQPGRRRLNQDLVVAVVRALGLDEQAVNRWRTACVRVHAEAKPRRTGAKPAELSADLTDFTGRTAVAERLAALLGQESSSPVAPVVLTAISGSGGVGKTSLAVHVAHRVLRRFPDGQLQVDLHGAGAVAAAPQDVLARFLRALGTPAEKIAVDPDERGAQYRSLLAERRVLILLDNVRDTAQVRPLLPGAGGSRVLITSRSALVGLDGAIRLALGVLDDEESPALFRRIVGAERSAAEPEAEGAVLEACAGLPLAIRLAAGRLVARPDWSVQDLADHLADETRRLNVLSVEDRAVRATFAVSYQNLSPDQARAFRLLALGPGPAATSLPAAAALLNLPLHEAAEYVEGLAAVHLIEQPSPGRYTMHDLIRIYAAERAHADEPADARDAATDRLLCWLLCTNGAASRMLQPDRRHLDLAPTQSDCRPITFNGSDDARTWSETEADHLVAAVALAAESGRDEIAWKLANTMWELFDVREERNGIPTYELALASARRLGAPEAVSWVLNALALAYRRFRRMPESEACLLQAIEIRRSLGDLRGEASCLGNLGYTMTESGRAAEAVPVLERCADIYHGLDLPRFEGAAHTNLGEAHKQLGQLDSALGHYRTALRLHRDADAFHLGRDQSNIADTLRRLARLSEAAEYAQRAYEANRRTGNRIDEAVALEVLGYASTAQGQALDARRRWEQALAILHDLNHPRAAELEALLQASTAAGPQRTR